MEIEIDVVRLADVLLLHDVVVTVITHLNEMIVALRETTIVVIVVEIDPVVLKIGAPLFLTCCCKRYKMN